MSAYPKKKLSSGPHVLKRRSDGKYLEVVGWSVEWGEEKSLLCPRFTTENMGPQRRDDFHKDLYARFRSVKARVEGMICDLIPYIDEASKTV